LRPWHHSILVEHVSWKDREQGQNGHLTQTYTATSTADASPVSGPMSYLHSEAQHIRHEATQALSAASSTHRYAGGMAQIKLKHSMARHESRRPSPKDTGPSVPETNLRTERSQASWFSVMVRVRKTEHVRYDVRIPRQHYVKYFDKVRFRSVFDSDRVDTCPVASARMGLAVPARHALLIRDDYVPSPRYGTYPALPHPSPGAFSREVGSGWWQGLSWKYPDFRNHISPHDPLSGCPHSVGPPCHGRSRGKREKATEESGANSMDIQETWSHIRSRLAKSRSPHAYLVTSQSKPYLRHYHCDARLSEPSQRCQRVELRRDTGYRVGL